MAHPLTHAQSSARRYGGIPEDYLPIHDLMDSSKESFPDNRHRALTHNTFFIFLLEKIFGHEIILTCQKCNGTGKTLDRDELGDKNVWCRDCDSTGKRGTAKVRYIGEQHVLEDFGGKFIPTAADYLEGMEFQPWMNNGVEGYPTSHRKLAPKGEITRRRAITLD